MNTREVSKTMGRACGRLLAILVFACLLAAVWMIAGTDETQAAEYKPTTKEELEEAAEKLVTGDVLDLSGLDVNDLSGLSDDYSVRIPASVENIQITGDPEVQLPLSIWVEGGEGNPVEAMTLENVNILGGIHFTRLVGVLRIDGVVTIESGYEGDGIGGSITSVLAVEGAGLAGGDRPQLVMNNVTRAFGLAEGTSLHDVDVLVNNDNAQLEYFNQGQIIITGSSVDINVSSDHRVDAIFSYPPEVEIINSDIDININIDVSDAESSAIISSNSPEKSFKIRGSTLTIDAEDVKFIADDDPYNNTNQLSFQEFSVVNSVVRANCPEQTFKADSYSFEGANYDCDVVPEQYETDGWRHFALKFLDGDNGDEPLTETLIVIQFDETAGDNEFVTEDIIRSDEDGVVHFWHKPGSFRFTARAGTIFSTYSLDSDDHKKKLEVSLTSRDEDTLVLTPTVLGEITDAIMRSAPENVVIDFSHYRKGRETLEETKVINIYLGTKNLTLIGKEGVPIDASFVVNQLRTSPLEVHVEDLYMRTGQGCCFDLFMDSQYENTMYFKGTSSLVTCDGVSAAIRVPDVTYAMSQEWLEDNPEKFALGKMTLTSEPADAEADADGNDAAQSAEEEGAAADSGQRGSLLVNTYTGGSYGAAIGGSSYESGGQIIIENLSVVAEAEQGAAIGGGGGYGQGGLITINNSDVVASSMYGTPVGGGSRSDGGNVTVTGSNLTCINQDSDLSQNPISVGYASNFPGFNPGDFTYTGSESVPTSGIIKAVNSNIRSYNNARTKAAVLAGNDVDRGYGQYRFVITGADGETRLENVPISIRKMTGFGTGSIVATVNTWETNTLNDRTSGGTLFLNLEAGNYRLEYGGEYEGEPIVATGSGDYADGEFTVNGMDNSYREIDLQLNLPEGAASAEPSITTDYALQTRSLEVGGISNMALGDLAQALKEYNGQFSILEAISDARLNLENNDGSFTFRSIKDHLGAQVGKVHVFKGAADEEEAAGTASRESGDLVPATVIFNVYGNGTFSDEDTGITLKGSVSEKTRIAVERINLTDQQKEAVGGEYDVHAAYKVTLFKAAEDGTDGTETVTLDEPLKISFPAADRVKKLVRLNDSGEARDVAEKGLFTGDTISTDITAGGTYVLMSEASSEYANDTYYGISVTPEELHIAKGESATLRATVHKDLNAQVSDKVTWRAEDDTVVSVSDGVVKGLKEGETQVTASCSGKSATATVIVSAKGEGSAVKTGDETSLLFIILMATIALAAATAIAMLLRRRIS